MDKKSRELVMAKLYFKNKDYKMAEKGFNEYLSMYPEDVAALKLLAQVYEQIKRFDKAFEMYERCYLAEPDRTGVLLDICRILLMNEVWLDNADYKKWLNLAIKTFPSNPIVGNLKTFLSTLPSDDSQTSPQRVVKTVSEDPVLLKILDKLSSMESKIDTLEQKISALSLNKTVANPIEAPMVSSQSFMMNTTHPPQVPSPAPQMQSPAPQVPSQTPQLTSSTSSSTKSPFSFQASPATSKPPVVTKQASPATTQTSLFSNQAPVFSNKAPLFNTQPPMFNPAPLFSNLSPQPNTNAPVFNTQTPMFSQTSLFGGLAPRAPLATSQSPLVTSQSPLVKSQPPPAESQTSPLTSQSPLVKSQSPLNKSQSPLTKGQSPSAANQGTLGTFSFVTPGSLSTSGNMFADSLSKLNMPTVGSWTTTIRPADFSFSKQAEKDNEENEHDSENVPNEELPIENTCDMKPIEVKTGEEDEDVIFEYRCKLFRLRDKEYKERGLGSIKVLKHKENGRGRLVMRRDAIGLVCLNCWNCTKIERVRETQVRFVGLDASDGEPEVTVFLTRFKLEETTDKFFSLLSSLFSDLPASSPNSKQPAPSKLTKSVSNEVELIDPVLDQSLVDKARKLQLPDLFYHQLKNQEPCKGCNGCEDE